MLTFKRPVLAVALATALLAACGARTAEEHLNAARQYLGKQDRKSAIVELKGALQKDPSMAEARFLLGKALLESGNPVSARIELDKARELGYAADPLLPLLARAMLALGEHEKLTKEFATAKLDSAEAQSELKASLAEAFLGLRQRDEAQQAVNDALAANPKNEHALLVAANVAGAGGDYDTALQRVDAVLAAQPNSAQAWLSKAEFLRFGVGKDSEALDAYRKALAADGKSVGANVGFITLMLLKGELKPAQEQLELMRKALPNNPQTRFVAALVALQEGNLKKATDESQAMLKLVPEDARFLHLAGAIAAQSGSLLVAERYLAQSLKLSGNNPPARLLLANTLLRNGEPAKAIAALQPLLDQQVHSHTALAMAGQAYLQLGETAQAEEAFSRAVKLDPKDVRSRTALAVVDVSKGRVDEGITTLKGLAATDTGATADLALISALMSRKDNERALAAITDLQKKQPTLADGPYLRGSVELRMGHADLARQAFEQTLQLSPNHFQAAAMLATLDLQENKLPAAIQRFERMLAKEPRNTRFRMALIELKLRAGASADEYVNLLKEAISQSPESVEPRLALIRHLVQQQDPKQALVVAQDGASALQDSAEMLEALGQVQGLAGDVNQAMSSLNKLTTLMPNSALPYVRMAEIYTNGRDYGAAVQSLRKGLAAEPQNLDVASQLLAVQLAAGQLEGARASLKELQAKLSPMAAAQLGGDVDYAQKNWAAAAAQYRSAMSKGASGTGIAVKLHIALLRGAQTAEAQKFAASWLGTHPTDLIFREHLASQAMAGGREAEAEALYRETLQLDSRRGVALNNLAWLLRKRQPAEAMNLAEQAVKYQPRVGSFWDTLAQLQLDAGQTDKAVQSARQALILMPDDPWHAVHLVQALKASGDKNGARAALKTLEASAGAERIAKELPALRTGL